MGWSLEIVADEFQEKLKRHGMKVNTKQSILITRAEAVRLSPGLTTDKYRKILRDAITAEEERLAAIAKAKQLPLL